jgi:hypothetical protein
MAFDLTKPSMLGATLAGEFGNIRENFRAIVQGDAGVVSQLWITANNAPLVFERASQTAKGRVVGSGDSTHEYVFLTSNASGGWTQWNRDNTGLRSWLFGITENDTIEARRATGASNPIAWTTLLTLDGSGRLGLGRTPTTYLFEVAGSINTVHPAASTSNSIASTGTTTAPNYWNIQNTGGSIVLGLESSTGGTLMSNAGAYSGVLYVGNTALQFGTNATTRFTISATGNVVMGTAALSTSATDGFFYIAGCAGAPTGTPSAVTGRVPLLYDTTNNKLYAYNGAWKSVTLT